MRIGRHDGTGRHEQRVAIRVRLGREIAADVAARAAAIINNNGLAPQFSQLLRDDARDNVVSAAGREGNDDAHRANRIVLRLRENCAEQ